MSVLMTLKVACDTDAFLAYAAENEDVLVAIAEDGKSQGAVHHRFGVGDGFLLVIDEWESAEAFQRFFEGQQQIPKVMAAAGAQGEPEITIAEAISSAGEF